jgi:hypothetical protein
MAYIILWNGMPAFLSQNGIWTTSNSPKDVVNTALGMSAAATGTCGLGDVDFGFSISYSLKLMGKIILRLN